MRAKISPPTFFLLAVSLFLDACQHTTSFNFGPYSEAERLYEKGKYLKAIAKYEEYVRDEPEGNMAVIARYYTAKSYENLGQSKQARKIYEKIAKEHRGLIWADFARDRLKELKQAQGISH